MASCGYPLIFEGMVDALGAWVWLHAKRHGSTMRISAQSEAVSAQQIGYSHAAESTVAAP